VPTLHRYKNSTHYYVKSVVNQGVVTYQLTGAGKSELLSRGIKDGEKFGHATLTKLLKSGDAFTSRTNPLQPTLFPIESLHVEGEVRTDDCASNSPSHEKEPSHSFLSAFLSYLVVPEKHTTY